MKHTHCRISTYLLSIVCLIALAAGCKKTPTKKNTPVARHGTIIPSMPTERLSANASTAPTSSQSSQAATRTVGEVKSGISFDVENKMFKTAYITCLSYQRKRDFGHWRWYKTPVYRIDQGQITTVNVDAGADEQDQKNIFGYLGVFNDEESAQEATYELVDDRCLLDLDLLWKLKNQKVTLEVETYGVRGEYLEYDFINEKGEQKSPQSLDFLVENQSGSPIITVGFIYEKHAKGKWIDWLNEKDDMSVWRFDKTPLLRLEPGEIGTIKLEPISSTRDISYLRGYLAVFDSDEEEKAQQSTFELLEADNKFSLGELFRLKNKKIIIDVQKYGLSQDFVDFTIKPVRHIDFTKIKNGKQ